MDGGFKQLSIALIVLGLSSAVQAASYGIAHIEAPSTVDEASFDLNVQVLYMRPHNDGDSMRYARSQVIAGSETSVVNHIIDTDYDWSFRVEGVYHDGLGNDVTINWLYHENDEEISKANVAIPRGAGLAFGTVVGNLDVQFNRIGVELGHTLEASHNFSFRTYVGAEYISFDDIISVDAGNNLVNNDTYLLRSKSRFEGWGIRTGGDLTWNFMDDFNFFVQSGLGLVAGDIDHRADLVLTGASAFQQHLNSEHHTSMVPDLSAVCGLNFVQNHWVVELGWRHDVLIHVKRFNEDDINGPENYSEGGAFLGFSWRGN